MRGNKKVRQELLQYIKTHKRLLNLVELTRRVLSRGCKCGDNDEEVIALTQGQIIKNYLGANQTCKLQIGSGPNALEGWLNTDINPTNENVLKLDATGTLPFDDCTFDYVFSEHLIEHLEYQDGIQFVRECYRVLKPSGKIRVSTPDFRFLIELYAEKKTELQERYIVWAVDSFLSHIGIYRDTFVINNFFRDWGHKFIYDYKTLRDVLEKCGFINITRYNPGESDDKDFQGIEAHGLVIPDEFNELESMVLEGAKNHLRDKNI